MKALILAAGFGSRLVPITNSIPKSLVEVNGKPILFKQIESLYANGITDITVVSGYKAEVLEERVHQHYPAVHILNNSAYADTNNMYSAYMAADKMKHSDFLMMNADVFFDESVVTALLKNPDPNAIVVEVGRYLEESMKVVVADERIVEISKAISEDQAHGTSIDVYKFSADGGAAFFARCADYIESKKQLKLWSEVALNDALADANFKVCPLDGRWFEIDTLEDLQEAKRIFAE